MQLRRADISTSQRTRPIWAPSPWAAPPGRSYPERPPATLTFSRISRLRGSITREGSQAGNLTSGSLTYSNNLEKIETIRSDGPQAAARRRLEAVESQARDRKESGLHSEVSAGVIANVARSQEEAKLQAKTGKAVISSDGEERIAEEEAARKAALEAEKLFEEGAAPSAEELMEDAAGKNAATQAAEKAADGKAG
ncbi:MAG: hypothetical protein V3V55_05460 [Rhodospirillales bacterium]